MSQRINPIGPYERRSMPVPRVERRKPTEDHHEQPEDGYEQFEEQLERGLRDSGQHKLPAAETPTVKVDLSSEASATPPQPGRSGEAGSSDGHPAQPEVRHIDVSA